MRAPIISKDEDALVEREAIGLLITGLIRYLDMRGSAEGWNLLASDSLRRTAEQLDERSSKIDPTDESFLFVQQVIARYRELVPEKPH